MKSGKGRIVASSTHLGRVREGALKATGLRFTVVVARFNSRVTYRLLLGALDALRRFGAREKDMEIVWVPGAFELGQAAAMAARRLRPAAVVCLGAVLRGGTPHFEYVSQQAAAGIQQASLASGVPMSFGVLTTNTMAQALSRAGGGVRNKGWDAAVAAIEMANLFRRR